VLPEAFDKNVPTLCSLPAMPALTAMSVIEVLITSAMLDCFGQ
jgi:hypothetical protein